MTIVEKFTRHGANFPAGSAILILVRKILIRELKRVLTGQTVSQSRAKFPVNLAARRRKAPYLLAHDKSIFSNLCSSGSDIRDQGLKEKPRRFRAKCEDEKGNPESCGKSRRFHRGTDGGI